MVKHDQHQMVKRDDRENDAKVHQDQAARDDRVAVTAPVVVSRVCWKTFRRLPWPT
jgi:hypothetical protein